VPGGATADSGTVIEDVDEEREIVDRVLHRWHPTGRFQTGAD